MSFLGVPENLFYGIGKAAQQEIGDTLFLNLFPCEKKNQDLFSKKGK